jgi:hypothetical protein
VGIAFLSVRLAYPGDGIGEPQPVMFTALRNPTLHYLQSSNAKRRRSSAEIGKLSDTLACPRSVRPQTQLKEADLLAIVQVGLAAHDPCKRHSRCCSTALNGSRKSKLSVVCPCIREGCQAALPTRSPSLLKPLSVRVTRGEKLAPRFAPLVLQLDGAERSGPHANSSPAT